ncbi:hypothetical protein B0H63DRAFT_514781, partial [Podospora didyma]
DHDRTKAVSCAISLSKVQLYGLFFSILGGVSSFGDAQPLSRAKHITSLFLWHP